VFRSFAQEHQTDTALIPVDSSFSVLDSTHNNKAIAFSQKEEKSFLEAPVTYNASDSIVIDLDQDIIRLYGTSDLKYQTTHLESHYIGIRMKACV